MVGGIWRLSFVLCRGSLVACEPPGTIQGAVPVVEPFGSPDTTYSIVGRSVSASGNDNGSHGAAL